MNEIQIAIAFTSGGLALAMALVSLPASFQKHGEKVDFVFAILCILMFLFFVFPPFGFVLDEHAPYPTDLIIKRIFNFSFFGLFPWFVYYYTGYTKKTLPVLVNILVVVSYGWMFFTKIDHQVPIWIYPALISMALIVLHGFLAVRYQFMIGGNKKAKWFRFAMRIFLLLFTCCVIYQLGNDYFFRQFHMKAFFPINLFPVAFIVVMGIRLRANTVEKFQLEKTLRLKNLQWDSHLHNIQLIIVRLDLTGKVKYINPYGVHLLQYNNDKEILGINWYDHFLPAQEAALQRDLFKKAESIISTKRSYKNTIITKEGQEKVITWNIELVYDNDGKLIEVMSVGSDITEKELAFQEINSLKSELEKENLMLKGEPVPDWMHQEIIGKSEAIEYAIQKAKKVASSQASVLLQGETGVGKELFADLIHRNSLRSAKPFVKVNCGALPTDLIEDELFGHEKGAFTSAGQSRKGRFEIADGGTIFLDEIGELPLSLQPKLLRVLQNGEFERIGGQQTLKVDVRIISATNKDLQSEVKSGRFRDDLFYRLNVYPISIPSLRSRKEDIPMLIQYYISRKSEKHNKAFKSISKGDMKSLCEYGWPGNIRELKNVIERSVISSEQNSVLRLDWFYSAISEKPGIATSLSLEQMEREYIVKVLTECRWRISGEHGAAEKLVMNPNTLRSKMKKLNISHQE